MRTALRCLGPALLALAACEPVKQPPVQVVAMVQGSDGIYAPATVELSTVRDIVALDGDAARLIGDARILVDPGDPLLTAGGLTDEQLRQVFVKQEGVAPRASYVEKEGVLWPADFHSWNMVSTYYNFERAYRYFVDNNVTVSELQDPRTGSGATAYYFPSFTLKEISDQPEADNAIFFSAIRGFVVLPFDQLQDVPLSMNSGVVAHEFAHRVFNLRAYAGAAIPIPFTRWVSGITATTPANVLKGFDEGLADFHAVGASCGSPRGCDTRFLQPSIGADLTDPRDMAAANHCMTGQLRNAINTLQLSEFTRQGLEYQLGTILSSALYKVSYPYKHQTMERALLAAYDDNNGSTLGFRQIIELNADTPGNVTMAVLLKAILMHIGDPTLKGDACAAFMDQLQVPKDDLLATAGEGEACPTAAAPYVTCPVLP